MKNLLKTAATVAALSLAVPAFAAEGAAATGTEKPADTSGQATTKPAAKKHHSSTAKKSSSSTKKSTSTSATSEKSGATSEKSGASAEKSSGAAAGETKTEGAK